MNQLSNIELLVNTTLPTASSQDSNDQFITSLKTEKERIIAEFQKMIFNLDDKLAQYIRVHQYKILELMETISTSLPHELFTNPATENPLIQLYYLLYDLHVYLEKNCAAYLDFHCKISLIYLQSARQLFIKEIPVLRQLFSGTGITESAQKIILAPFEKVIQSDNVSFQRVHYLKKLSTLLQQLPPESTTEHIDKLLLFMNFNNGYYVEYKLASLSENIKSFSTNDQQLIQIDWLLKINNQQREHPNYQYAHNLPSLKEQIREWLTYESTYLERKLLRPESPLLPEEVARWQAFKVKVDLSVNEIGYLLRLMMEHGMILNTNRTEVADFFAQYFAAKNQASISGVSLRQKLYSYLPSSAESVRDHLLGLFNTSKRLKLEN